jgi:hypothetical protein
MFNEAAYKHSDPVKYKVVDYLNKKGSWTICFEDKSTEDIKVLVPYNLEIEHRTIWRGEKFPYETISIPYRKYKHKKKNTFFYIVNNEMSHAIIVNSLLLINSFIVVKNTTRQKNEKFFHIPMNKCKKIKL